MIKLAAVVFGLGLAACFTMAPVGLGSDERKNSPSEQMSDEDASLGDGRVAQDAGSGGDSAAATSDSAAAPDSADEDDESELSEDDESDELPEDGADEEPADAEEGADEA